MSRPLYMDIDGLMQPALQGQQRRRGEYSRPCDAVAANLQRLSLVRTEAVKDLRLAERFLAIGMFQHEGSQFPRWRGQRNHFVVEALVRQIELVSIAQLLEPIAVHHRNGDRVLADRHSRKGVRRYKVEEVKAVPFA